MVKFSIVGRKDKKMKLDDFLKEVISRGLISIRETYKEGDPRRDGGIAGFNICSDFHTPEDFENAIEASMSIEFELMKGADKGKTRQYERQRYITLQLRYVYELMKVAWNKSTPRIYSFPTLSARAVLQYAKIVGVKE